MITTNNFLNDNIKEIQKLIGKVSEINSAKGDSVAIADKAGDLFKMIFATDFLFSNNISNMYIEKNTLNNFQTEKPSSLGTVVWVKTNRSLYFHENLQEIFRRLVTGGKLLVVGVVSVDTFSAVAPENTLSWGSMIENPHDICGFQELVMKIHEAGFGDIEILFRKDFSAANDNDEKSNFSLTAVSAVKQCIGQVFEGCPAGCHKCE